MEEIVALVSGGPTGPRQGAKNSISAVRLRAAASERPNSSRSRQYRGPSPTAELLKSCSSVLTLMQHLSRSIVVLQYDVVDGPPVCYNGAEDFVPPSEQGRSHSQPFGLTGLYNSATATAGRRGQAKLTGPSSSPCSYWRVSAHSKQPTTHYGVQLRPKRPPSLAMSVMSTNASGGAGAMLYRAGADGIVCPKSRPTMEMSVMSTIRSLLMSAGHAFVPQRIFGFVPIVASSESGQPSPSVSGRGVLRHESLPLSRTVLDVFTNCHE